MNVLDNGANALRLRTVAAILAAGLLRSTGHFPGVVCSNAAQDVAPNFSPAHLQSSPELCSVSRVVNETPRTRRAQWR